MLSLVLCLFLQTPPVVPRQPVAISPKQVSLLTEEAKWIKSHSDSTKKRLGPLEAENNFTGEQAVLGDAVRQAKQRVVSTQKEFSATEQQRADADTYFGDFVNRYDLLAAEIKELRPDVYERTRDEMFAILEDNRLAYLLLAKEGLGRFDLAVNSIPQDATVSYRKTGDPYKKHPNNTDTTIENLEYAVWTVRVHKDDYEDQEKSHDPYREKNHVLHFDLKKK